jgi:Ca2+-binding EF-hand superfamily protein
MDLIIDAFLTELFSKFDQNGDSRISLSEAKNIFRGLNQRSGLLLTNADAEHFISSLATNGDGNVDINEFKSGINRLIKNQ